MESTGSNEIADGGKSGTENFRASYSRATTKRVAFLIFAVVLTIFLAMYGVTVGSYKIEFTEVYKYIWDWITGATPDNATKYHIAAEVRFPRILTALVAGFGLAIAGCTMQAMLKNPLADPYTMGISSGAGFGAAIAILLGIEVIAGGGVVLNAFIFAIIPSLVILFLSKFHSASPTMMVLCGIGMMYLFNAVTQIFMLTSHPEDMATVYQWMVGSISGTSFDNVLVMAAVVIPGCLIIQILSKSLNAMGLGDESAKSLGVDVEKSRLFMMLVLTVVAAAVVSYTGIIGFIGLVAPHIARLFVGTDNRYLLIASGLIGACLLIFADIISRMLIAPHILPVGVITSCIGGPLFLILVLRSRREVWN